MAQKLLMHTHESHIIHYGFQKFSLNYEVNPNYQTKKFAFVYELDRPIEEKLAAIVQKVYRGAGVALTPAARKQAAELTALGFGSLPICMAKTQYSFSDNQSLLGAPEKFTVTVCNIKVSAGAGFLVAMTGNIMTMPGLPKVSAAEKVDVDDTGKISGLF